MGRQNTGVKMKLGFSATPGSSSRPPPCLPASYDHHGEIIWAGPTSKSELSTLNTVTVGKI